MLANNYFLVKKGNEDILEFLGVLRGDPAVLVTK